MGRNVTGGRSLLRYSPMMHGHRFLAHHGYGGLNLEGVSGDHDRHRALGSPRDWRGLHVVGAAHMPSHVDAALFTIRSVVWTTSGRRKHGEVQILR